MDPDDEGTKLPRKIGNYILINTTIVQDLNQMLRQRAN